MVRWEVAYNIIDLLTILYFYINPHQCTCSSWVGMRHSHSGLPSCCQLACSFSHCKLACLSCYSFLPHLLGLDFGPHLVTDEVQEVDIRASSASGSGWGWGWVYMLPNCQKHDSSLHASKQGPWTLQIVHFEQPRLSTVLCIQCHAILQLCMLKLNNIIGK